jgi:hypothetical protein
MRRLMKRWVLSVRTSRGVIHRVALRTEGMVLGSADTADLRIEEEAILARHVRIAPRADRIRVEAMDGLVRVDGRVLESAQEWDSPVVVELPGVQLAIEADPEATLPVDSSGWEGDLDATVLMADGMDDGEFGVWEEAPLRGSYRLREEIARGGMGQIYSGDDPQLRRQVAVKVSHLSGTGVDARFTREAEVLARLAHPNIVPIYSQGTDKRGRPFYAMKLVNGLTLQKVLDGLRRGDGEMGAAYPLATLLTVFRKVCDGVAFAHSKGILHRDLKPENIMLGEYGEVLVMDWGLAKVKGMAEEPVVGTVGRDTGVGMTLEGAVMGTPQYMSPEQATGMVADLNERSDVYSLGGILYAVLTRFPPVEGTTVREILTRVQTGQIRPMEEAGRDGRGASRKREVRIPDALQAVVRKALAREREERYRSVEELVREIEAYQNGFATEAEGAGAWRQFLLFVRRNRGVSAAAGLLLAMAIVFTVRLGVAKERAQRSESLAKENERKALVARESARQEAARAQVALAEAAEESGDAEQMRLALSKVPEDLRDPNWAYLAERSDAADLKIAPPDGVPWLEVEDCPAESGSILALQTHGCVSRVDTKTGAVTSLWKAQRAGAILHSFTVSQQGDAVAVVWVRDKTLEIEVRNSETGVLIIPEILVDHREDPDALFRSRSMVRVSKTRVFVWSHSKEKGERLEVWDIATGSPVWRREQVRSFTLGDDAVLLLDTDGVSLRLDPRDGRLLSKSTEKLRDAEQFNPGNLWLDPKQRCVVVGKFYGKQFVRWHNPEGFQLRWEKRYEDRAPLYVRPDARFKTVAVLCERSILGGVMEIRDVETGDLIRAYPFQKGWREQVAFRRVAGNDSGFAMAVDGRILVWRTGLEEPVSRIHGLPLGDTAYSVHSEAAGTDSKLVVSDLKLNPIAERRVEGFGFNRAGVVSQNLTGTRVALRYYEKMGAYRIDGDRIEELWAPRPISGPQQFSVHPTQDLIWSGDRMLEHSTGRELHRLDLGNLTTLSFSGSHRGGVWVGDNHLVATVIQGRGRAREGPAVGEERSLALWNTDTGKLEAQALAPRVLDLAGSRDGRRIAEGGDDRKVRIREGASLRVEREFRAHDGEVDSVAWHPSLPYLVTHARGSLRIWDARTWAMVEELRVVYGKGMVWVAGGGRRVAVRMESGWTFLYEPGVFRE